MDEYDVYDSMVEALHDSLPAGSTTADTILPEILDAKVQDDTLTLLVSFFGGQGSAYQTKSSRRQLSYAILQAKEGSCAHVKTLNYAQVNLVWFLCCRHPRTFAYQLHSSRSRILDHFQHLACTFPQAHDWLL